MKTFIEERQNTLSFSFSEDLESFLLDVKSITFESRLITKVLWEALTLVNNIRCYTIWNSRMNMPSYIKALSNTQPI